VCVCVCVCVKLYLNGQTVMSELTSDDDEETVNFTSATRCFSSCALLFGLKRKGVILCGFEYLYEGKADVVYLQVTLCDPHLSA